MTADEAVALALTWGGISAASATYDQYVQIIALIEPGWLAREMSKESGCGLVCRGYLRNVLPTLPPELTEIYLNGHALSDLEAIARRAGAIRPSMYEAVPGDILHVGRGTLAPEHVAIVTNVDDDGFSLGSIQGGMRDDFGNEKIGAMKRTIMRGRSAASDREANGITRPVLGWYSLGALLAYYR